jgi:hypothetical protein
MTVIAVHSEIPGMEFVAIGNRLDRCISGHNNFRMTDVHREAGASKYKSA